MNLDNVEHYSEWNSIGYVENIGVYTDKFQVNIWNSAIDENRIVRDSTKYGLKWKIEDIFKKWAEKEKKLEAKEKIEASKDSADKKTEEYQNLLSDIDSILIDTLSVDDVVDWEILKDKYTFPENNPMDRLPEKLEKISKPIPKEKEQLPYKPDELDLKYTPKFNVFDKIFPKLKQAKVQTCKDDYEWDLKEWTKDCDGVNKRNEQKISENQKNLLKYNNKIESVENQYTEMYNEWCERKKNFENNQAEYNASVEKRKENYFLLDEVAVTEYCELVLDSSKYPDFFSPKYEIAYNSVNKILIVEYFLPAPEKFPKIKEVRYIAIRDEMKEFMISEAELNRNFDKTMYNITLRTIHELFEADVANAIDAINFNGWIDTVDKATGNKTENCILTIQVKKEDFLKINLANVDPKMCFKNMKGIASSKLNTITPVRPIIQIERHDKRLTESYSVTGEIDNSTNLAAMDWEDFEHLIRELFEKEFSSNGGECKVTRASRDGGVDAIAYDPDPIRGGKIVIQAKRYTNTVGVSAVRDLYGTVLNEGATKGILVTTADYGPDAYEFAKSKPLTLLNGANLLYLLEKHGHRARIDIKEAREKIL